MIRVDPSLFANVSSAIQRTANLTGGSVRGLPGGAVIEGLRGVTSFSADLADAHNEFKLGRRRTALERVKQIEMQFNGIASRWNGTVGSLISSARTGKQGLSIQKLNEVKSAQAKMVQLTAPVTKCFRDLVTALEHEVALEGHESKDEVESQEAEEEKLDQQVEGKSAESKRMPPIGNGQQEVNTDDLGRFADRYQFGPQLQIQKRTSGSARVVPSLAVGKFYYCGGWDPPAVLRVREIEPDRVLVLDTYRSQERSVDAKTLKRLIESGMWLLVAN